MKLIQQGAEAKIYLDKNTIIKERISKSYRHKILDNQIRKRRTKSETKILNKAAEIANVPKVIKTEDYKITIEFIEGDKLSEKLNSYSQEKQYKVMRELGTQVAKLHEANIIHGDLTTSNTILKENSVFIIDFGLGFISTKIEDKAVDLHLIKQALEAKHYHDYKNLFKEFCSAYNNPEILERLKVVEKRGRYKH